MLSDLLQVSICDEFQGDCTIRQCDIYCRWLIYFYEMVTKSQQRNRLAWGLLICKCKRTYRWIGQKQQRTHLKKGLHFKHGFKQKNIKYSSYSWTVLWHKYCSHHWVKSKYCVTFLLEMFWIICMSHMCGELSLLHVMWQVFRGYVSVV